MRYPLHILTTAVLARPAWATDDGAAMLKLASTSGCMTCLHIEHGAKGPNGLAPTGLDPDQLQWAAAC